MCNYVAYNRHFELCFFTYIKDRAVKFAGVFGNCGVTAIFVTGPEVTTLTDSA